MRYSELFEGSTVNALTVLSELKSILQRVSPRAVYEIDGDGEVISLYTRYWGEWEVPSDVDDDEAQDYDWQQPTSASERKLKEILTSFRLKYSDWNIRVDTGEKDSIFFYAEKKNVTEATITKDQVSSVAVYGLFDKLAQQYTGLQNDIIWSSSYTDSSKTKFAVRWRFMYDDIWSRPHVGWRQNVHKLNNANNIIEGLAEQYSNLVVDMKYFTEDDAMKRSRELGYDAEYAFTDSQRTFSGYVMFQVPK